jgi:NADH:ubiquinone oxidoreductase subunit K
MTGILLFGIGLVGLIIRINTSRMFLALAVMITGMALTAAAWIQPPSEAEMFSIFLASLVAGMWITTAILMVRLEGRACESPNGKATVQINTQLYVLLTAVGLVILACVLRMGS